MPNYFLILFQKNFHLVFKNPVRLVTQLVYPIFIAAMWHRTIEAVLSKNYEFKEFCVLPVAAKCDNEEITKYFRDKVLVYSPVGNDELEKVMKQFRSTFKQVTPLKNKFELMEYYLTQNSTNLLAALEFEDNLALAPTLPEHLIVRVKFPGELHFKKRQHYDWRTNDKFVKRQNFFRHPFYDHPINPKYYREGFLTLQQALVYFILNSTENFPRIDIKRFSVPDGFPTSSIMHLAQIWTGRIFVYLNLLQFLLSTRDIAIERNNRFKSLTRIFGIPNWAHWSAWFAKEFLGYCYQITILLLAMKVNWHETELLPYSDPSVIIFTLIFYSWAMIAMSFLIATLVPTELYALMVALCIFVVTQMPTHFITKNLNKLSFLSKLSICLLPNTAISIATHLISLEDNPITYGVRWTNIGHNYPDNNFPYAYVMIMLLIDSIIFLTVALYAEALSPGKFGVARTIFLTRKHRQIGPLADEQSDTESVNSLHNRSSMAIWQFNNYGDSGITAYNLTKIYGRHEIVVDLNFEALKGQITVLLGHSKCGKTTTLLMLSGLINPTRGNVYIDGFNLATRLKDAQKVIGWGPQKPYFIPELTVRDHIYFFSRLKGLGKKQAKENVMRYISMLQLVDKEKAKNLSPAGEKKLTIAIALSGNSRVILLDEPTAGLDLNSQKIVWDCLQNEKAERTILLSTQIISEAEKLGDRIAIIARGRLQCYGTTYFLKRTFGAGYHLTLVKSERCDTDVVTSFFRKYLPNLQIYRNQESELIYILKSTDEEEFVDMFTDLEQSLEKLNLKSFGITVTSLEEVLLRITGEPTKEKAYAAPKSEGLSKRNLPFFNYTE